MDTNNTKSTWPTPAPHVGDPTPPIFHLLALGVGFGGNANFSFRVGGNANFSFRVGGNANFSFRVGGNANFSVFRYQDVGIPNSKL